MDFGDPVFVILIVGISMLAWVATTAIRAKYGYPISDDCGKLVHPRNRETDDATNALVSENEQLKNTVGRLEERLKVLERIATDPSRRLTDEIEKLR